MCLEFTSSALKGFKNWESSDIFPLPIEFPWLHRSVHLFLIFQDFFVRLRRFRLIRSNDINAVYKKNNYNLTNTCHELNGFVGVPLKSRRSDFQIGDKLNDTACSLQYLQEVSCICWSMPPKSEESRPIFKPNLYSTHILYVIIKKRSK